SAVEQCKCGGHGDGPAVQCKRESRPVAYPLGGAGTLPGAYRMREPMISVHKISTSGIDWRWHKCRCEARNRAGDMKDEISKQMMLQIATITSASQSAPHIGNQEAALKAV